MVSQSVLAELAAFNVSSVADLLGADAEVKLAAVIENRQEAVDSALKALSLQYPGYAKSIQARQLERAADPLRSGGICPAPARRHHQPRGLRRPAPTARRAAQRHRRASAARSRPGTDQDDRARADLRIARPQAAVVEVGKRLRAVVALPGEKIVRDRRAARRHVFHRRRRGDGERPRLRGDAEGGRLLRRDGPAERPARATPTWSPTATAIC